MLVQNLVLNCLNLYWMGAPLSPALSLALPARSAAVTCMTGVIVKNGLKSRDKKD